MLVRCSGNALKVLLTISLISVAILILTVVLMSGDRNLISVHSESPRRMVERNVVEAAGNQLQAFLGICQALDKHSLAFFSILNHLWLGVKILRHSAAKLLAMKSVRGDENFLSV